MKQNTFSPNIKNVSFLGLDVRFPVFFSSLALALIFSILVLAYPKESSNILTEIRVFVVNWFDTLFTVSMTTFLLLLLLIMVSPFGNIKLGRNDSQPEFTFF